MLLYQQEHKRNVFSCGYLLGQPATLARAIDGALVATKLDCHVSS